MPGLVIVDDCDLCEIHNGEADGMTWSEYDTRYGRFNIIAESSRPFAPGAESWDDAMARVRRFLEAVAARPVGKTVVVVTHSGFVIASVLGLLAVQSSVDRATLGPGYTSLRCWRWADNRWSLECFNDVAHLPHRADASTTT